MGEKHFLQDSFWPETSIDLIMTLLYEKFFFKNRFLYLYLIIKTIIKTIYFGSTNDNLLRKWWSWNFKEKKAFFVQHLRPDSRRGLEKWCKCEPGSTLSPCSSNQKGKKTFLRNLSSSLVIDNENDIFYENVELLGKN